MNEDDDREDKIQLLERGPRKPEIPPHLDEHIRRHVFRTRTVFLTACPTCRQRTTQPLLAYLETIPPTIIRLDKGKLVERPNPEWAKLSKHGRPPEPLRPRQLWTPVAGLAGMGLLFMVNGFLGTGASLLVLALGLALFQPHYETALYPKKYAAWRAGVQDAKARLFCRTCRTIFDSVTRNIVRKSPGQEEDSVV